MGGRIFKVSPVDQVLHYKLALSRGELSIFKRLLQPVTFLDLGVRQNPYIPVTILLAKLIR
jgi:hypothetical protein